MPSELAKGWNDLSRAERETVLTLMECEHAAIPMIASGAWGDLTWYVRHRIAELLWKRLKG